MTRNISEEKEEKEVPTSSHFPTEHVGEVIKSGEECNHKSDDLSYYSEISSLKVQSDRRV